MTPLGGWAETAGNDELPNSLTFKIPAQSTAIAMKKQTEFFSTGASVYSPAGQKVIRFNLTDSVNWLQPDSCYLKFVCVNPGSADITMAAPAYAMISSLRVFASGTPVALATKGTVRLARGFASRMKISNKLKYYLMNLTKLHLRPIALAKKNITDSAIRRLIVDAGDDVDDLMILCRADITTKNERKFKKYLSNFERVEEAMKNVKLRDELKNFQPPISGLDIMEKLKLKAGKEVGIIKNHIKDAILDGKIKNTYEDALNYMMSIKDKILK